MGCSSQPSLALCGEQKPSWGWIWGDVHGSGVIRTERSWARCLPHPAGTKGVMLSEFWTHLHGQGQVPHPLGAHPSRCSSCHVFPGQVIFWDLSASLHHLFSLNSETCLAFLLVQSALPWSMTVSAQGTEAGVVLLAWPELWAGGGLEPCPCALHIQFSFVSVELQTSAKWRASHRSSKSPADKYVPSLEADCHLIRSAVIKGGNWQVTLCKVFGDKWRVPGVKL